MIWGNAKWKQRPREEQAEIDGSEEVEKVATLLGVDSTELIKGLLKPRIKVTTKFWNKAVILQFSYSNKLYFMFILKLFYQVYIAYIYVTGT